MAVITVPTGSGVSRSLSNYGMGLAAGIGFNLISKFTARLNMGGLIGGALAAALTGAIVPGETGKIITTTLGFTLGARGLENLGLGGALGGLVGTSTNQPSTGPTFNMV